MERMMTLFLDKKFPFYVEVENGIHPRLLNHKSLKYKSGDKILFIVLIDIRKKQKTYHFFEADPKQLADWFKISYGQARKFIIDWAESKLKKQPA